MLPEADRNRVLHMHEAAEQAMMFLRGRTRGDLDNDVQLRLALLRTLEILGEAASRVSAETQASHPEIPWRQMVSTRNRLIHAYFDVDLDIVWITAMKAQPEGAWRCTRCSGRAGPRLSGKRSHGPL